MSIRILLADDHRIMREGLRAMLDSLPGTSVVGEANNGRTAVKLAAELKPDIVVMDITMPDLNGIEATRQLAADCPGVKVIALSIHSDRRFISGMFRAGAAGYLLKDCAFEELNGAIQAVASGHTYVSPVIADQVIKDYVGRTPAAGPDVSAPQLTGREREVLQLLAEGKSTREISLHLQVSIKTVETYRQQLMSKIGVHSVAELTKYAIREGLTTL
jgi:two-component system, NarL family, response regulator NreC